MSLTGTYHAFASIDERGTNRALEAFFQARPHYLHYGSPPFVTSGNSVTETELSPIAFPGIAGGIPYAVDLSIPVVDLYPPDGALPAPLVLGPDQLAITTRATITVGCTTSGREGKGGTVTPVATTLDVIAIADPVSVYFGPGTGYVSFHVDQVLLPGVAPESLQAVLDCLLRMILNAVLASVQLPFNTVDAGFVKLMLEAGPTIADNQIEIWGDVS
jgi:hypothetical protein